MRFFFLGPRVLGIRTGISLGPKDFRKLAYPSGTAQKSTMTGGFVYVLKNGTGRHKIGSSRDPIQRIAQLQTGSSQPLDFAYVGVAPADTYIQIEQAAHDLLERQQVPDVGDEWFQVPASIAIGAVIEVSNRLGLLIQQVQPIMVPQILAIAAQESKQQSMPGKYCGMLNPFPWYIRWTVGPLLGLVCAGGVLVAIGMISILVQGVPN